MSNISFSFLVRFICSLPGFAFLAQYISKIYLGETLSFSLLCNTLRWLYKNLFIFPVDELPPP